MYYVSTRNKEDRRTAAEAIAQGLAVDGGLMTPEVFPKRPLSCLPMRTRPTAERSSM